MRIQPQAQGEPVPPRISKAWPAFAKCLSAALARLQEDQYLILSVKQSNRFVQFAAQGAFGMRMEATSNSYLPESEKLGPRQISSLVSLGWNIPTGNPAQATPEADPDGSPNYFIEYPRPVPFDAVAEQAVRTLCEVLQVSHPARLEYQAFDEEGQALELSELDLRRTKAPSNAPKKDELAQRLQATLKVACRIDDLQFDRDGDLAVRFGSALAFARVLEDPAYVRFFAQVLHEVPQGQALLARINEINAGESLLRLVHLKDSVWAAAEICAVPFVETHVAAGFQHFCSTIDRVGELLQAEFGGSTAFAVTVRSRAVH